MAAAVASNIRVPEGMAVGEFGVKSVRLFWRYLDDETGATAIEYGLIAALIMITTIASMEQLGNTILSVFSKVETTMNNNVK